jgi:hypothetical protein
MHAGMCVHQRELSIQLTFPSIDSGPVGGERRRALVPRRRDYTYVTILYILHVRLHFACDPVPTGFVRGETRMLCAAHGFGVAPAQCACSVGDTHAPYRYLSLSLHPFQKVN